MDLPFDFDLVDGEIVPRGTTSHWHNTVRDRLYLRLETARRSPSAVNSEQYVLIDQYNPPKPDVVVFDKTGLDVFSLECLPVASVSLTVEVVSPDSCSDDRFRKPGLYAEAGIPYFWRVERGAEDLPEVFEFWLDRESGVYAPAPKGGHHVGQLKTELPFPVEIDLRRLLDL
ncbi:Uma2 family endonuclease [Kitasatospora sp. NBC_01287]|uniref:Uma2 family endonuclease n=1 Tax=Kitasatospora sp. NBC_01287 TaxID=2903573 RepID=UPI002255300A|nr:Uma2 family endonuclease [Kitasatospora sp. NBC_01287]MCX4748620.1 Uma2 family endonuclease [Kitasatospora sp. NBC_01287]